MVVRGPNKSTSRPRYCVSARSVQWRAAPPHGHYPFTPLSAAVAPFLKFERPHSPSGVNALAYASAARTKHTPAKAACASPFHVAAKRSSAGSTRLCSLLRRRALRLSSILRSSREYQLGACRASTMCQARVMRFRSALGSPRQRPESLSPPSQTTVSIAIAGFLPQQQKV